jgi:HPt (histidine-containing phosphotransfer) domain-containing protein
VTRKRQPQAVEPLESADDDAGELAALLEAFNHDGEFFKDVAEMFITDYPPMVETVEKAIADEDGALLSRTAHALRGMARNFQDRWGGGCRPPTGNAGRSGSV